MRQTLRILKYTGLAAGLLAGAGITFLYARRPETAAAATIRIEPTPERLARGNYIYTLADCDGCHSERDFSRFGGPVVAGRQGVGTILPKDMGLPGIVAPPNLTPDRETGIGEWTDGEKIRAIREGVDRNGRALFPMMPYEGYRQMSDEDVYSLVAYLNSLPPVKHAVPATQLNFPVGLLIKATPKPAGHVARPDASDRRAYGEYLATIGGCKECHTPSLAGGVKFQLAPGIAVVTANISPDETTGTGRWREQDFVERFAQYREYVANGAPPAGPQSMTLMPWLSLAQLTDDDLRAIYAYVRSVPPVTKAVETHPGWDPPRVVAGVGFGRM